MKPLPDDRPAAGERPLGNGSASVGSSTPGRDSDEDNHQSLSPRHRAVVLWLCILAIAMLFSGAATASDTTRTGSEPGPGRFSFDRALSKACIVFGEDVDKFLRGDDVSAIDVPKLY